MYLDRIDRKSSYMCLTLLDLRSAKCIESHNISSRSFVHFGCLMFICLISTTESMSLTSQRSKFMICLQGENWKGNPLRIMGNLKSDKTDPFR